MKFRSRSVPMLCSADAHSTGNMRISRTAERSPSRMCSAGSVPLSKILLHQGVVALGHHLDQRFVRLLRGVGQVGGNFAFLALAIAVGSVGVGLHRDQVDDAFEIALGADGKLNGDGGAAEIGLDAFEGAVEAGAFAIEFIN